MIIVAKLTVKMKNAVGLRTRIDKKSWDDNNHRNEVVCVHITHRITAASFVRNVLSAGIKAHCKMLMKPYFKTGKRKTRCSAVQCSAVQCSAVQCNVMCSVINVM